MPIDIIISVMAATLTTFGTYIAKREFDKVDEKKEEIKVKEAIESVVIGESDDNVLSLMLKNVKELREYYVISKQQARKSFSAALFICFFGIIIYLLGILAYIVWNKDISIISIVAGTVVEVIAGLFFWLYREATKQLSVYHQRLGMTEKYLMAYQMICEVPKEHRYEEQRNFINYVLNDNQYQIKNDKGTSM